MVTNNQGNKLNVREYVRPMHLGKFEDGTEGVYRKDGSVVLAHMHQLRRMVVPHCMHCRNEIQRADAEQTMYLRREIVQCHIICITRRTASDRMQKLRRNIG